jgi:hypothetical protein
MNLGHFDENDDFGQIGTFYPLIFSVLFGLKW